MKRYTHISGNPNNFPSVVGTASYKSIHTALHGLPSSLGLLRVYLHGHAKRALYCSRRFGLCYTLTQVIKGIKGVPVTRMVAFKEGQGSRISDKHLTWSLSRNGLYAGDVLVVRFEGCTTAWTGHH